MSEIVNVLGNATMAHTNMNYDIDAKKIVESVFKIIEEDKENIIKANQIDIKNNNGFKIDFDKIQLLKERLLTIDDSYRKLITMRKDEQNNYIIGTQSDKLGTICLIYDGNTYNLLEMILKSFLTHNAIIVASENNYMMGTNKLIIILIQRILDAFSVDKNLIQYIYLKEFDELLKNNASINKVFVIGNSSLHQKVRKSSEIETVYIGYDDYDIYIEDITHIELLKTIIQKADNINVFVKQDIEFPYKECFYVVDIDEAIGQINFNTSGYSSSIFTDNTENATLFLRDVKTDNISVNASPVNNNFINVSISLFLKNKNLYYPNPFNENEKNNRIEFPTQRAILEKKKNDKMKNEISNLKKENDNLRKTNKEIENSSSIQLDEKDKEIQELKRQLNESQQLVNKYINIFQKSTFSRIFGKLSKEDIEKDLKLLS